VPESALDDKAMLAGRAALPRDRSIAAVRACALQPT
jgi:hypothetical protein